MFGSVVLDVAIGVALLFLLTSLVCSALREALETVLRARAMDLERGIRQILSDENGTGLTAKLFDHPLVDSLFAGSYDAAKLEPSGLLPGATGPKVMPWRARTNLPTYIPSATFAAALLDVLRTTVGASAPLKLADLQEGAAKIQNERVRMAVVAALTDAGDDVTGARRNIEAWYDATMDRVSGWYKRRTQVILLAIGLLAAGLFNLDVVHVARHLATDKAFRDAVVAQAAKVAPSPGPDVAGGEAGLKAALDRASALRQELDAAGFALGWPPPQCALWSAGGSCTVWEIGQMLFGWIVTALAVSLGAPFWFDLLNKFMVVRSTVKPAEKSGVEASKDG